MPLAFWTDSFFKEAESALDADSETAKTLSGIETSILLRCEDRAESFLVEVAAGRVRVKRLGSNDKPEFTLSAPYDEWAKIAKGEEKVQREIVKGKVKFLGSWPKMLLYINKVVRLETEMLKKIGQLSVEY